MILVCDLEADNLLYKATRIWCIAAIDADTEQVYKYGPDQIEDGLELLSKADKIVFHNGLGYDIPLLKKLYPSWTYKSCDDTFILSSLFNPDRPTPPGCTGPHGIDAWGVRFGRPKPQHSDWSKFSEDMMHRCVEDAQIGLMTYRYLQKKRSEWDWELAIKIEYTIAQVQAEQEKNGVVFNKRKAIDLWIRIVKELQGLEKELLALLPLRCVGIGNPVSKPFKKDGSYSAMVTSFFESEELEVRRVGGPFSRINFIQFNLNSDMQIKAYLLAQGWKPTEWNYQKDASGKWLYDEGGQKLKSSPKLTEDSFVTVTGGLGPLLARRAILTHRKGLIYSYSTQKKMPVGWLTKIRDDGRIAAEAVPQAAVTSRFRHSVIVNVPANDAVYGEESRGLFGPGEGRVQVGCDAAQIEARCQCHNIFPYKGGPEYAKVLLEGDVHAENAKLFGCTRNESKPVYYGTLYGASAGKIAETLGCSLDRGKELFELFWQGNPSLKELKDDLTKEFKANKKKGKGFIVGLDGRQLLGRSEHSLINLKFQHDGAILFKLAMIYLFHKWIPAAGIDVKLMMNFHDEFQASVNPKDVSTYKELALKAFVCAGEFFSYRVPIVGDVKEGTSWKECH